MKTSLWVLTTTLLLLLGLFQSHPPEPGRSIETTLDRRQMGDFDTESPTHVYRGEIGRTPEDVEKDGGFYSRGLQKSHNHMEAAFQKNVKFNKNTFQNQRGAGVAPQPAGFPRLSTAWQEDPWRHFKAQDVQKNLDDLIASVCAGKHSCMTQLGHSSKQKSAKTPWTSNGADRPTRWEAGEAKAKSSQERLPGVRKSGDAGGLLAPYLQDVLRRLRSWDHPTGQTVKLFDDGINGAHQLLQARLLGAAERDAGAGAARGPGAPVVRGEEQEAAGQCQRRPRHLRARRAAAGRQGEAYLCPPPQEGNGD
ncbi:hypothetical protein MAC_08378 [Metarhizium acridum CQMa 102]|uniref:Uncharacterized protein n=1 Tax=Metarhizium acridum (strain CQMa 102) TaxID=655827 RepID=E9EET0_METAQ|nr:uncharacterized protein MAC_08378 [Metarhizium acridum CQMa 102]EFY85598.1 hypothetical protein MAC_08378 [Metarhizium acridum CQMa 102]